MRTTVTIPDEYYEKIEAKYRAEGFTTINDFILDVVRHHFDGGSSFTGTILQESHKTPSTDVTSQEPNYQPAWRPSEEPQLHRCDAPYCKSMEAVQVKGVGYTDEGEVSYVRYLCEAHIKAAKKSGEEITEI